MALGGLFQPISREGGLVMNNLLLSVATATVFLGTLYPLFLDATTGQKQTPHTHNPGQTQAQDKCKHDTTFEALGGVPRQ